MVWKNTRFSGTEKFFFVLAYLLNVVVSYSQGSVLLTGGGSENYNDWSDAPYQWMVQKATNKKILVLHYSTVSTFLPDYFKSLGAAQSVSLAVPSSSADDSTIFNTILTYDGIFLRGGDQWEYISQWKGTLTEKAIQQVFQRGGVIGGTSAGAMVLSKIICDAKITSVDPRTALKNPLGAQITFTNNFLGFVPNSICDTHFYERGRIGRLIAMLALYHQQKNEWLTGIGIDDGTALAIDSSLHAVVFGSGVVSILTAKPATMYQIKPGKPFEIFNLRLKQYTNGAAFTLNNLEVLFFPANTFSFSADTYEESSASFILDGSGAFADWQRSSGSLSKFINAFNLNDTIGLVTDSPSLSEIQNLQNYFSQKSIPYLLLNASVTNLSSSTFMDSVQSCNGFIFCGISSNAVDILSDKENPIGALLKNKKNLLAPFLFLGDAVKIVGSNNINGTELSATAAYRGRLTLSSGLHWISSTLWISRSYENPDYLENRFSGIFWGIGKTKSSFGILADAGTSIQISNSKIQVSGYSPVIIIDASENAASSFPEYRASSSIGPRQNCAFSEITIHVIAEPSVFDFKTGNVVASTTENNMSVYHHQFMLEQNFPNPFNPHTQIRFSIPEEDNVDLTLVDLLGRRISTLFHGTLSAGTHSINFSSSGYNLSSGVYFYLLHTSRGVIVKKMMILK